MDGTYKYVHSVYSMHQLIKRTSRGPRVTYPEVACSVCSFVGLRSLCVLFDKRSATFCV